MNFTLVSKHARKTVSTLTVYWPRNIAKKEEIVENNLSIYVSTKHLPI